MDPEARRRSSRPRSILYATVTDRWRRSCRTEPPGLGAGWRSMAGRPVRRLRFRSGDGRRWTRRPAGGRAGRVSICARQLRTAGGDFAELNRGASGPVCGNGGTHRPATSVLGWGDGIRSDRVPICARQCRTAGGDLAELSRRPRGRFAVNGGTPRPAITV